MIFSEEWLKEWIDPQMSVENLVGRLTMAGLEVDGVSPVAYSFNGIVVGEVLSVERHSNADKLKVCKVSDGVENYQVVCGAPNVKAGIKVPFARKGAEILIPGDSKPFKIKAAKIRGEQSNGMLCSAEELGLEDKSEGLLELTEQVKLGDDIREVLSLEDKSIELDLTPNRGDCLGMRGLAREVGVLTRGDYQEPQVSHALIAHDTELPIEIFAQSQ